MWLGMMAIPDACCVGIRALHSWHIWNTFPKEPQNKHGVPGVLLFAAGNRWTAKPQLPENFSSPAVELMSHVLEFKFSFPFCLVLQSSSHFPSALLCSHCNSSSFLRQDGVTWEQPGFPSGWDRQPDSPKDSSDHSCAHSFPQLFSFPSF